MEFTIFKNTLTVHSASAEIMGQGCLLDGIRNCDKLQIGLSTTRIGPDASCSERFVTLLKTS